MTNVPTFLSQAHDNNFTGSTFSAFYTLDTNLTSKIIFGPPQAEKYGKAGSKNSDIQYCSVPHTSTMDMEQWIVPVTGVKFGNKMITDQTHQTGHNV